MDLQGAASTARHFIRDRDGKKPAVFGAILADRGITAVRSGVEGLRMNAIMERWQAPPEYPARVPGPQPQTWR
jgi:hypothetical protein